MLGLYSKSATLALLLLCLGAVHAAPLAAEKRTVSTALRLARDGENISQSTTLQTQETIQTAVGPMLQICTIKLDPITGDKGDPLVRETKSCTVQMTSSGNNASGSNGSNGSSDSGSSSSQSAAASATSSDSNASATATSASEVPGSALPSGSTGSASGSTLTVAPSATASASSGGSGAVSAGGFSSIDKSAVATATSASGSAAATGSASASASGSASATITDSASATSTGTAVGAAASDGASGTSAADTAATSAASFQLPGTKLQVLPIGLGVFAGISVIALIVVGLVTYERTKYRKAFRQRKLAESGAAMGYGGMA
ncbi:hypothetical protein C8Q78DRAFT_444882 [Trametes maxima]|nr:hypothetical protein C8Q78DRAFT_444882 [Trametes maxima]